MSSSSLTTFMESWCRKAGPRWPGSLKTPRAMALAPELSWACFGATGARWIGRLSSFHSQASSQQCFWWVESWRALTWRPRLTIRSRSVVCGVGQEARACAATGWMSMSPALSVGLSVVEVKIKCQCWCILLRNEIGSHPIPTNPAEQCVCSGFDWVAASGLIVMYKVLGEKLGKGANFYANTPCWNIPHVPWQHCFNSSMRSCSNRLLRSGFNGLWKLGSMSCWGSYQNQTLPQPFPTIPYHCTAGKPISGWMPLPPVRDMLDSLARILAAFCSTSRHCFHISPTLNQC